MKDDSLPPLIKINDSLMAATMGCTLMTKRSSAEILKVASNHWLLNHLQIHQVYPLVEDYQKFRSLFASGVDCYIINTGFYMGNGIPKEVSLDIIEKIVDGNVDFKAFGPIEGFEYLALEDYPVHRFDAKYKQLIRSRMQIRLNFLLSFNQTILTSSAC